MNGLHAGSWFGFGSGMWVWWILLLFVIVLFIKAVSGTRENPAALPGADPLRILKTRYARGEIDHEDYVRRKAELESKPE